MKKTNHLIRHIYLIWKGGLGWKFVVVYVNSSIVDVGILAKTKPM